MGGYPDLNRKLTVPHTAVLPIELHPPLLYIFKYIQQKISKLTKKKPYVGVIRTLISKYQKFMTYQLVYNISKFNYRLHYFVLCKTKLKQF